MQHKLPVLFFFLKDMRAKQGTLARALHPVSRHCRLPKEGCVRVEVGEAEGMSDREEMTSRGFHGQDHCNSRYMRAVRPGGL